MALSKKACRCFYLAQSKLGFSRNLSSAVSSESTKRSWGDRRGDSIVLVDGVRTPFMVSGTEFAVPEVHTVELAQFALRELQKKTGIDKKEVEYIVMGTAIQEIQANNVSRDAALLAGYPSTVPAHTVSMACISSFQSITSCVAHIKSGLMEACIAGGTDFMSDLPIRYSRPIRSAILKTAKAKTFSQKLSILSSLTFSSLVPEIPLSKEFTTKEMVGMAAQRLADSMNVSREEQDAYALRSHQLAKKAYDYGYLTDIVPYKVPGTSKVFRQDNGVRATSMEQLAKLKPAFLASPKGSVTAGNSTFLSDGASACLLMTEQKAKALGLRPKAYVRSFTYSSQDPVALPLSGSVFAIPKVLEQSRMTLKDIQVWELLEDFAGQVLANLKAMDSDAYAQKYMNRSKKVGAPPIEKLNAWGGSLAVGHPFGATGVRLCTQAANRLIREDGQFACVTGVAVGGQGVSIILERHPDGTA